VPVQEPEAVHEVALVEDQLKVTDPLVGALATELVSIAVGAGESNATSKPTRISIFDLHPACDYHRFYPRGAQLETPHAIECLPGNLAAGAQVGVLASRKRALPRRFW
jgi:hypothetical protein